MSFNSQASVVSCLADGAFGKVCEEAGQAILYLPGTRISAGTHMASTFHYLLTERSFRARDLPVETSMAQKVEFLRKLVLDGLIVKYPDPSV